MFRQPFNTLPFHQAYVENIMATKEVAKTLLEFAKEARNWKKNK
jgi:hypothetical protein